MKTMLMAVFCLFFVATAMAATTRDHGVATPYLRAMADSTRDHSVATLAVEPEEKKEAPAKEAPAKEAEKKEEKKDEAPSMETLRIKFEIENFNYYDLTKETCPKVEHKKHHHHKKHKKADTKADKKEQPAVAPPLPEPKVADVPAISEPEKLPWMRKGAQDTPPPPAPKGPPPSADAKPAIDEVHSNTDYIANAVKRDLGGFGKQDDSLKPPWMQKKAQVNAPSFLQVSEKVGACVARQDLGETKSTECTTIMDVLRDTIQETVSGIIRCLYLESLEAPAAVSPSAAQPASPASAVAFLEAKPAPAPAPAPAGPPPMPDVKIFVTFNAGKKIGKGRATQVEITFIDTAGNGVDDVLAAKPYLVWCMKNGLFKNQLEDALDEVTNIVPDIHDPELKTEKIEQWNIKKCEKHIRSIVDEFTHHYTRRQVPMALYNECTNFMTRMSFSHDYVLDPMDTVRCRRSTKKFAEHWNYGKKAEEKDFEQMCLNACEAKYGHHAPKCHVVHGQGLLNAPK